MRQLCSKLKKIQFLGLVGKVISQTQAKRSPLSFVVLEILILHENSYANQHVFRGRINLGVKEEVSQIYFKKAVEDSRLS